MKMLSEITEMMTAAIATAKGEGKGTACGTYSCNDGYIDIWCDSRDDMEVVIVQDEDKGRKHPNLEEAIYNAIPEWDDVTIEEDSFSDWVTFYGRV